MLDFASRRRSVKRWIPAFAGYEMPLPLPTVTGDRDFCARPSVHIMSRVKWVLDLWYETSPYVYFIVGLASMLFSTSAYGFAFSTLLIVVAVTIFSLRRAYRSPERQKYRKYSRPRA